MNAAAAAPPRIYDLHEMPRVDAHVHIPYPEAPDDREPFKRREAREAADAFVKIMDESRITVCVNLSGNREMVEAAGTIHQTWRNRILFAPATWDVREGLLRRPQHHRLEAANRCAQSHLLLERGAADSPGA